MAKDQLIDVKDAVFKLQLSLLEGIQDENQLFAAGSLMSRSDYEDVVVERTIANLCGYPLCRNPLPSKPPRKGHYRISLTEHKVYDLHESYMYCSSSCVVNSRAFAGILQQERCSVLNPAKIDEILSMFGDLNLESKDGMGKNEDLGLGNLKIQEKMETKDGEVSLEEWMGPSNAIEGYVPQRDRISKSSRAKNKREGSKTNQAKPKIDKTLIFNEMDFMSEIIIGDGYNISKTVSGSKTTASKFNSKESKGEVIPVKAVQLEAPSGSVQNNAKRELRELKQKGSCAVPKTELNIPEISSGQCQNDTDAYATEAKEELHAANVAQSGETMRKSSLKSSGSKKQTHSVTWADENIDNRGDSRNLCEIKELEDGKEDTDRLSSMEMVADDNLLRFVSAEACAEALSQAAEAVSSGESDVNYAVSEAGVIILPRSDDMDERESTEDCDMHEPEPTTLKWPRKPGISHSDIFDSEDSWYDAPPEGFSLNLSPFATMWMALFEWVTSSSLAYIYGRDENFHEEYLSINGREYPRKIVLTDGRSSEIKQTLAGCLARALPGVAGELRLPLPISTLEQGMGRLLDTMSFVEALPAFRVKQWKVISLLFLDALSVCRIPALTPHLTSRRTLLHKVLDGAQVSVEEYEVMKDFVIPLGRAPQFSVQSGG